MPLSEQERRDAYAAVLRTSEGNDVLMDLVNFAQAVDVSEARLLGRCDVVTRFLDKREKAKYKLVEENPDEHDT